MLLKEALEAVPDVIALTARPGQILVYPRHVPPGVFVVLEGVLFRFEGSAQEPYDAGDRIDASSGPFAIPGPAEANEPAQAGVVAGTDVRILFVPRSVVLRDQSIARLLTLAGVPAEPLRHRRAG
jgi:hypothetical protein